jgi:hypothetical protein
MHSLLKAFRFLYSSRADEEPLEGSAAWAFWIVPLGLGIGIALAVVLGFCWPRLTYSPGALWMVAVPAMLLYWLGPGGARYAALGRTWASIRLGARLNDQPRENYPGAECLSLVVLTVTAAAVAQFVAVAMLPIVHPATIPGVPGFLQQWLFPWKHFGAIVLMTTWGNAAVLLASCIGRPAGHCEPSVRQLLASPAWPRLLLGLLIPAAVSMLFIVGWRGELPDRWVQTLALSAFDTLGIAAIMFGVTTLFAWLLARRVQGHCRSTLLSAGLVGEITFLVIFHAMYKVT